MNGNASMKVYLYKNLKKIKQYRKVNPNVIPQNH